MATRINLPVPSLLNIAEDLLARGVMRRYGAVVSHVRVGYTANAMGCWIIPPRKIENIGRTMASFSAVSHCYQRPTHDDWPYNLFTMIHGHTPEECKSVADQIALQTDTKDYTLLYTKKEYKKERIVYFA